jgi:hypothetical protein
VHTRNELRIKAQQYHNANGSLIGFGTHQISDGDGTFEAKTKGSKNGRTRVSIVPARSGVQSDTQKIDDIKDQTVLGSKPLKTKIKTKALQRHHQRMVNLYKPFFEGLNLLQKIELAEWFAKEGAPLGDTPGNPVDMRTRDHHAIHKWMRDNKIEVGKSKQTSFKGLSLNERFAPALMYLEHVQAAVDEQMGKYKTYPAKPVSTLTSSNGAVKFSTTSPNPTNGNGNGNSNGNGNGNGKKNGNGKPNGKPNGKSNGNILPGNRAVIQSSPTIPGAVSLAFEPSTRSVNTGLHGPHMFLP